jgi:flagellar biosynthesis component FlhA
MDSPIPTTEPQKISEQDNLRLKLLSLEMENCQLKLGQLNVSVQAEVKRRDELTKKMAAMSKEYSERYGVNMMSVQIDDDGVIHPLPQGAMR